MHILPNIIKIVADNISMRRHTPSRGLLQPQEYWWYDESTALWTLVNHDRARVLVRNYIHSYAKNNNMASPILRELREYTIVDKILKQLSIENIMHTTQASIIPIAGKKVIDLSGVQPTIRDRTMHDKCHMYYARGMYNPDIGTTDIDAMTGIMDECYPGLGEYIQQVLGYMILPTNPSNYMFCFVSDTPSDKIKPSNHLYRNFNPMFYFLKFVLGNEVTRHAMSGNGAISHGTSCYIDPIHCSTIYCMNAFDKDKQPILSAKLIDETRYSKKATSKPLLIAPNVTGEWYWFTVGQNGCIIIPRANAPLNAKLSELYQEKRTLDWFTWIVLGAKKVIDNDGRIPRPANLSSILRSQNIINKDENDWMTHAITSLSHLSTEEEPHTTKKESSDTFTCNPCAHWRTNDDDDRWDSDDDGW